MSIVFGVQSLILIRRRRRGRSGAEAPSPEVSAGEIGWEPVVKVLSAILLLFLYYLAVVWIGMLPASIVFLVIFSLLYGERRFKITVPLAVSLSLIIYLFFTKISKIPLPGGIFFE